MIKTFTDSQGRLWGLTDRAPQRGSHFQLSIVPERRHLWPVPAGWEIATPIELETMLELVHPDDEVGPVPGSR